MVIFGHNVSSLPAGFIMTIFTTGVHTRLHPCTDTHTRHAQMHLSLRARVHTHTHSLSLSRTRARAHTHIHTHTNTLARACTNTYTHTRTHTHTYTGMYLHQMRSDWSPAHEVRRKLAEHHPVGVSLHGDAAWNWRTMLKVSLNGNRSQQTESLLLYVGPETVNRLCLQFPLGLTCLFENDRLTHRACSFALFLCLSVRFYLFVCLLACGFLLLDCPLKFF